MTKSEPQGLAPILTYAVRATLALLVAIVAGLGVMLSSFAWVSSMTESWTEPLITLALAICALVVAVRMLDRTSLKAYGASSGDLKHPLVRHVRLTAWVGASALGVFAVADVVFTLWLVSELGQAVEGSSRIWTVYGKPAVALMVTQLLLLSAAGMMVLSSRPDFNPDPQVVRSQDFSD